MKIFSKVINTTPDGLQRSINEKTAGLTGTSESTPNFCDKTSWYYTSIRVIDEVPVKLDAYTVQLSKYPILNLQKVTHRERMVDKILLIKKNNVVINSNFDIIPNGYSIDYINGKIIFDTDITNDDIKVSYNYIVNNVYEIVSDGASDKVITYGEIQVSDDCDLTNMYVKFEPIINNISTGGTDVVLATELNSYLDLLNISNGGTYIPKVGNDTCGYIILPMNYMNSFVIKPHGATADNVDYVHNEYNKIRISLLDNTKEINGLFTTFSLYYYIR